MEGGLLSTLLRAQGPAPAPPPQALNLQDILASSRLEEKVEFDMRNEKIWAARVIRRFLTEALRSCHDCPSRG